jgi:L-2,4-diaminobutyrate decarboxylase
VAKSLDFIGLGRNALRSIAADAGGRMDPNALERQIKQDLQAGFMPMCVIGVAGTSATGSIDPLEPIADIAAAHGLWLHVDGAAGMAFASLPEMRHHFRGMGQADSITIDPHKWLFMPHGIGCLLVKSGTMLRESFEAASPYAEDPDEPDLYQMSLAGTRQWRSLGLWMAFKQLGVEGYRTLLRTMIAALRHLEERIPRDGKLELLMQPTLPVVCLRPRGTDAQAQNALTQHVHQRLVEQGDHYVTLVDWNGASYLRVAINNHTTTAKHIDALVDSIHALLPS